MTTSPRLPATPQAAAHACELSPRLYADLVGRPFEMGARGPDAFDCYGLVAAVLGRMGIEVPDYPSNHQAIHNATTIFYAMSHWHRLEKPEPGAVVVFRMNLRAPTHVGLMLGVDRFVHILEKTHVAVERISSPIWKQRVMGWYKWPTS